MANNKRKKKRTKKEQLRFKKIFLVVLVLVLFALGLNQKQIKQVINTLGSVSRPIYAASIEDIPEYNDHAYVIINDNEPYFTEDDLTTEAFEEYAPLDMLGRCGSAYANICKEIMPTEERGAIGHVKPSGWQTVKYNGIVEGNYLYNRCHLIGFQLAGENANERNLITGTRYLNIDGMVDFENQVADYVKQTGNHVLYRVTPVFEGTELVARGVQMEALSVEDNGEGIKFNVYCYNVQPGIDIDYSDGTSKLSEQ